MKLSCLPVSLYPALASGVITLPNWFHIANTLGLDGADLSVAHIQERTPHYLRSLRQAASDNGVEIPMIVTYTDFTLPDAAQRAQQVEDLRAWIAAAAELGVSYLRVTAGQNHEGITEEDGLKWATEGLTACVEEARQAGVELLYENHVRGALWSQNDFTQPVARYLEVVRRSAESGLRLLFDTANPLALGDDPLALLDQVKNRVGAIHLSDIRQVGTFEPTVIGTGVAPHTQILRSMVESGFDGWISIEEGSKTGLESFHHAVKVVDQIWVDVGGKARARRNSAAAC